MNQTKMNRSSALAAAILVMCASALAQDVTTNFVDRLVEAAIERTAHDVAYDGSYRRLSYPGGDVPDNIGVCTDVVVRAYRAVDVDLQKLVHEDMVAHFAEYPQLWGQSRPDANIDHRRVPNLQTFLERQGAQLSVTEVGSDYHPGDLVTWLLPGNLPHIGIVVGAGSGTDPVPRVVHNIGSGPMIEDALFRYPITGHYRYPGPE